jgi:THO complex subunit 2
MLDGLPSSSSGPSANSLNAAIFGELLVDLIWSVDAELEEVIADAKAVIASCGDHGSAFKTKDTRDTPSKDRSLVLSKVMKAKQNAENDKETVTLVVKKFLVRGSISYA